MKENTTNNEKNKERPQNKNLMPPMKKGETRNPNGRPKGALGFWAKLEAVFNLVNNRQPGEKKLKDVEELILKAFLKQLYKGNYTAIKDIIDRKWGKTPEQININTPEVVLTPEEIKKYFK